MYDWMDELYDIERIEYPRHTQQRLGIFHSSASMTPENLKAFVIKKIKDLVQPRTVHAR